MLLFPRTLLATSISAAMLVPVTHAETPEPNSVQEMPMSDQCLIPDSSPKITMISPLWSKRMPLKV